MPRLGMGMPIISETSEAAVLAVEDFVFLNDVSGELTPVDTSSRTNKILHSQDLKQSTWTKTNSAIASDLYEAPDNSTTANAIQNDATSDEERKVTATHAVVAGETYTLSGHFKKGLYNFVKLYHSDTAVAFSAFFNITTGAVSSASNTLSTSFDKMDDGWIRCSITFQATATGNGGLILSAAPTSSSASASIASGADQDLIYVWGMQLEEDSRPTAYIVTTNAVVNVATNELNDVSNVWDFDGTDIMLEVDPENEGAFEEATANLVLNHDYEELGSELVTNRDFASDTIWTKGSGWTIGSGVATCDGTNSALLFQSLANTTTNDIFKATYTISNYVSGSVFVGFGSGLVQPSGTTRNANGTYTQYLTKTSTSTSFGFKSISFVGSIDNISVKEVDPNDRWVLGTGWSISDGKAVAVATSSSGFSITQNNILTSNTQYEITYTLSDITAGSVRFRANLVSGTQRGSNGTYTEIITTAGDDFAFQGLDSFVGKIDNVTVKEYAITPLNV